MDASFAAVSLGKTHLPTMISAFNCIFYKYSLSNENYSIKNNLILQKIKYKALYFGLGRYYSWENSKRDVFGLLLYFKLSFQFVAWREDD